MTWLVSMMLWSVRLGVALGMSPPLVSYGLPLLVRMALVLALAALTAGATPSTPLLSSLAADPAHLLQAVAAEVVAGMLLGLGIHVALAAFAVAGRILDVQVGFGIGSIFD